MDKLIIEFNKKFDKQKQELIDGFKALGEEKRLPKALATIEGEQPTYKDYFKAGWQSRQAEVDQLKEAMERQGKLAIQAMNEAHKGSRLELSIAKDIQASLKPELIESERQMNTQLTDENMRLEARIDAALKHANLNFWNAVTVGLMVKALRGEHEA